MYNSGRGNGLRPGYIRVNVRSRKEICVNETMEMPNQTTLASLRQFLRKTFPYLPWYFKFETENKVKIDHNLEKRIAVATLGPTIYLYPFIPKYPKGQDPETLLAKKMAAMDGGGGGGSPDGKKGKKAMLDPISSPGTPAAKPGSPGGGLFGSMRGDEELFYEEEYGDEGLVPSAVRSKIRDEWEQDRIASMTRTGAISPPSSATANGIPPDLMTVLRTSGLDGLAINLDMGEFRVVTSYENRVNKVALTLRPQSLSISLTLTPTLTLILTQTHKTPSVSFDDKKEFRRFAMKQTLMMNLHPEALRIQQKVRTKLAKKRVSQKRLEIAAEAERLALLDGMDVMDSTGDERFAGVTALAPPPTFSPASFAGESSSEMYSKGDEVLARVAGSADFLPARVVERARSGTYTLAFYHGETLTDIVTSDMIWNKEMVGVPQSATAPAPAFEVVERPMAASPPTTGLYDTSNFARPKGYKPQKSKLVQNIEQAILDMDHAAHDNFLAEFTHSPTLEKMKQEKTGQDVVNGTKKVVVAIDDDLSEVKRRKQANADKKLAAERNKKEPAERARQAAAARDKTEAQAKVEEAEKKKEEKEMKEKEAARQRKLREERAKSVTPQSVAEEQTSMIIEAAVHKATTVAPNFRPVTPQKVAQDQTGIIIDAALARSSRPSTAERTNTDPTFTYAAASAVHNSVNQAVRRTPPRY